MSSIARILYSANELGPMSPHPQVVALLEAAAASPLPSMEKVSAFVARRLYRERCARVAPKAPEALTRLLVTPGGLALRAYRPPGTAKETLPALAYFHGGGWSIGDLDTHDVLCRELALGARCAVFSVEYRLAPEAPFPAAVDDCLAATEFVLQQKDLLIDTSRVAVGGDSAGANLAAVVAIALKEKIAFQLLIYPATDQRMNTESLKRNGEGYLLTRAMMNVFRGNYLPREADRLDWRASPLLAPSLAGVAPAFLLTAGFDPLVDEGRAYAERLAREGVEVSYRNYEDMVHGFIVMGGVLDTAREAVADCCAALAARFEKVTA
jgi:acetyl esterase